VSLAVGYGAYPGALGSALPALGIAGMIALGAFEMACAVRHLFCCRYTKIGHRCTCPRLHRVLAGYPLHGFRQTDATWLRKADHHEGHVSPFQKLPVWQRRAARTGPVLAVLGALISWPLTAVAVALAAVVACCALHPLRGRARLPERVAALVPPPLRERAGRHHGDRAQDMAQALAGITGTAAGSIRPQIRWNPGYASARPGEQVATWNLPRGFKALAREKQQVEDLWSNRVGFALVFTWKTTEVPPKLVITRAKQMRPIVYLHDVLDKLAELDDSKSGVGVDDQDGLVSWCWNTENPHGVMNAGSRHGKTEINKCLVAQILRKGGGVTYIDPKEISLQGMEGIPGLTLRNDPGDIPAMWEAIADFRHVMDGRRVERARYGKDAVAGWDRRLLILEEVNQFSEQSDDFWEDLPEEEEGFLGTELWKPRKAKKTPRVWRHVKAVAWQGAAFKMHVFVDGQDVQSMVLKGVRNSLGMRLLGGYLPQQWKFLVGTTPVPAAPNHKGRFCLVIGNDQTWLQAILGDKDPDKSSALWREYALNGREPVAVPSGGGIWAVSGDGEIKRQVSAARSGILQPGTFPPMGLADIVRAGLVTGSESALKKDRQRSDLGELRDGLVFPEPVGMDGKQKELFDVAEVQAFDAMRRGYLRGAGS